MRKVNLLAEGFVKLADIFDIKDGKFTAVKKPEDIKSIGKKFRKKSDGTILFKGDEKNYIADDKQVVSKIEHELPDLEKASSEEEELTAGNNSDDKAPEKDGKPHGANISSDKFKTLGISTAYGVLLGNDMQPDKIWKNDTKKVDTTKTGLDPKEITQHLVLTDLKDKIKLLFDDYDFPDSYFKSDKIIGDFMTDMARRKAYYDAEKKGKLKSDVKYVNGEGDEAEYDKIIESDDATKGYYNKAYNDYEQALADGLKQGSETVQKGGKVQDPITKKTVDVKPDLAAKIKTGLADMMKAAGDIAADILGLDNKDIFSRMVKYALGGKKLSDILRSGTKSILKQGEKLKNSDVKKHNVDTMKAIADAEKKKALPTKDDDNSPATQMVKKSLEENLNNIITKAAVFAAMTQGADHQGLFEVQGEEKKFLFSTFKGKENVPLANEKRKLLIEAIRLYVELYDKGIRKSKIWKNMKVSEKKISVDLNWKKDAFEAALSDKFTTDPDVKDRIKEYQALFDVIASSEYQPGELTNKTCEKFRESVSKLSQDIKGREIEQLQDVKVTSEIPDVIGFTNDRKGKEEEQGETEIPKEVEADAVKAAKMTVSMPDHVADPDYDKKLDATKKEIETGRKSLEDWMKSDEEAQNIIFKAIKPIEQFKSQMLPQVWLFGHLGKLKAMFESYLEFREMKRLMLEATGADEGETVETDEQPAEKGNEEQDAKQKEEWKKKAEELLKGIDEILKKEKPSDFATAYESWGKAVTELFGNMAENEKLKEKLAEVKDEDPYVKLCTVGHILTAKNEKAKDQPEAAAEESGDNEDGTDAAKQNDGNVQDSMKPEFFLGSFRSYLAESIKNIK